MSAIDDWDHAAQAGLIAARRQIVDRRRRRERCPLAAQRGRSLRRHNRVDQHGPADRKRRGNRTRCSRKSECARGEPESAGNRAADSDGQDRHGDRKYESKGVLAPAAGASAASRQRVECDEISAVYAPGHPVTLQHISAVDTGNHRLNTGVDAVAASQIMQALGAVDFDDVALARIERVSSDYDAHTSALCRYVAVTRYPWRPRDTMSCATTIGRGACSTRP